MFMSHGNTGEKLTIGISMYSLCLKWDRVNTKQVIFTTIYNH